jgi:excisionase family DNA binding protein
VAEFLGLSERTIIRRVEQGCFPAPYRVGRSWLFRIRDLRRWLADGNKPGGAAQETKEVAKGAARRRA